MMKKKTIWVCVLTAVVFLSMVAVGIATVFRIDEVTLRPTIVSQAATEEIDVLHERLSAAYENESYFSADKKPAEKILKDFPYFRMTSFKKRSPNRIEITVTEDVEAYAVPVKGEDSRYYILGEDGVVLGVRDTYINRLDGASNLLITGLDVTGEKGKMLVGDDCVEELFAFCGVVSQSLGGIRRNVVSIEVLKMTSAAEETFFRLTMKEGVRIYVGNPYVMTTEKAQAVIEKYLSLTDSERLTGRVAVSERAGELVIGYAEKDDFDF